MPADTSVCLTSRALICLSTDALAGTLVAHSRRDVGRGAAGYSQSACSSGYSYTGAGTDAATRDQERDQVRVPSGVGGVHRSTANPHRWSWQQPRDEQAVYEELHTSMPRRYAISPTNTTKHTGTIRWYNAAKGIGFIAPNVPGPNLFLHHSGLAPGYTEPEPGESVSYYPMPTAPNERAMMAHEKMTVAVEHAIDVEPANKNRVTFGGVSGGDNVSVAWTNVSGLTNPWAKGSRPPQRHAPTPPTWSMYSPEDEDDYEQPEPDVYELALLAAAQARLDDEADLDFDRPSSPLETRPSGCTSFAEMREAMAGIDFNPDPSEIQIGGGDSPRLLSTTESHQNSMLAARERTRKAHREGKRAHHNRTLLISHTGHEGGKGSKNPKHKGIESFTAPRKFANTGRVHRKSHGSYLHKEEERPVQRPKGRHPMKKELADVSFELVDHRPPSLQGGVYRQPKKKPRAPRVVAVARPIVSDGYKPQKQRAPSTWAAPRIAAGTGAIVSEPEPEPEPQPEPQPQPQPELQLEPEDRQKDREGGQSRHGTEQLGQTQQLERVEQASQLGLQENQEAQEIERSSCSRNSSARGSGALAISQGGEATAASLRVGARSRLASKPGHLDRSSRVRHPPGARPQRPHEKAWARHPARGEWYLANDSEEQENLNALGTISSTSVGQTRSRKRANGSSALTGSITQHSRRSKLQQRREAREQRERQRKALVALKPG